MRADQLKTTVASWWRWVMTTSIVLLAALGAMTAVQYTRLNSAYTDIERSEQIGHAVDRLMSTPKPAIAATCSPTTRCSSSRTAASTAPPTTRWSS